VHWVSVTNLYNRINVATRQPPGASWNDRGTPMPAYQTTARALLQRPQS
jgi:hypothetical protein